MELYIIRHGDPDYDNDTLTEYGWKQAEALAERLLIDKIDTIYSSPLGRAKATAKPYATKTGIDIIIQPWASEIGPLNMPNMHFLSDECMEKGFRWFDLEQFPRALGEVIAAKHNGLDAMLAHNGYERKGDKYIPYAPNNKKIALFCHGNMSNMIIAHLLNVPVNKAYAQTILFTTSVTVFHFDNNPEGSLPVMTMFNERRHLKNLPDPNVDKIPQA